MALLPTEEELLKKKLTDPFAGLTGLGGTVTGGAQALPGFDPAAERARREQQINLQATQGQEQIGRMFGIQPTGLQTGQAVARFAPIEAQRMGNLASLESELSQRGPAEARANLALQNQIYQGQQSAGLQAGQLSLQGLMGYGAKDLQQQALAEQIAARQGQQSLQAGQLTGTYGGADTLQQQALLEQIRAQQAQEGFTGRGVTLQEQLGTGQLGLAERQQILDEAARTQQFGLAERGLSLEEQLGMGGLGLQQQQLGLQERLGLAGQKLAERAQGVQETQAQQSLGLQQQQLGLQERLGIAGLGLEQQQLQLQQQSINQAADFESGRIGLARDQLDRQMGLDQQQLNLQQAGLDLNTEIQRGNLALAEAGQEFGQDVTRAELTGYWQQFGAEDYDAFKSAFGSSAGGGGLDVPPFRGGPVEASREGYMAFQNWVTGLPSDYQQALQEYEMGRGTILSPDEANKLAQDPNGFMRQITNGQLGGGGEPDPRYNESYDFNKDGKIDFPDFVAFAQKVDQGVATMAKQQLDANIDQSAQQLGIQRDQVDNALAMYEGEMAQRIKEFDTAYYRNTYESDLAFKEGKRRYDADFQQTADKITAELGLRTDQLDLQQSQILATMLSGAMGAGGFLSTLATSGPGAQIAGAVAGAGTAGAGAGAGVAGAGAAGTAGAVGAIAAALPFLAAFGVAGMTGAIEFGSLPRTDEILTKLNLTPQRIQGLTDAEFQQVLQNMPLGAGRVYHKDDEAAIMQRIRDLRGV